MRKYILAQMRKLTIHFLLYKEALSLYILKKDKFVGLRMLYHLSLALQDHLPALTTFHAISVRSVCALLSSLMLALLFGERFIAATKEHFAAPSRENTPQRHRAKDNTPTMGGIFIILVVTISTLIWNNLADPKVLLMLGALSGFGLLGFLDDRAKIQKKKGISASLKFRLQLLVALAVAGSWYYFCTPNTEVIIPFIRSYTPTLGLLLLPWAALTMIATSNAVNLTDGLDGLACGPLIFSFGTFGVIAYLAGHQTFASYLGIPFTGTAELAIVACSLIGALIGFLWYNTYPAQIFMGDVGSLSLGAALGLLALMSRHELLLFLAGGIFAAETISVIVQLASYRLRGKRLFLMAPFHHHFELLGWSEPKITVRFWIVSFILCLLSLLTLKMR